MDWLPEFEGIIVFGPFASSHNLSDFVGRADALVLLQLVFDHDQKGISGVFAWLGPIFGGFREF